MAIQKPTMMMTLQHVWRENDAEEETVNKTRSEETGQDESELDYLNIHMCRWEGKHCVEWANSLCQSRSVDANEVDLRGFKGMTGLTLQNMSREEICGIVGNQYGAMFWKELRTYKAKQKHRCSNCVSSDSTPLMMPLHDSFDMQEMASDLSVHNLTSEPETNSHPVEHQGGSPQYQEVESPYAVSLKTSPRYSEEAFSPEYRERSLSPSFQRHFAPYEHYSYENLSPIVFKPLTYSETQQVSLGIKDQDGDVDAIPHTRKPMPDLILIKDFCNLPESPPLDGQTEVPDIQNYAHFHSDQPTHFHDQPTHLPGHQTCHQNFAGHYFGHHHQSQMYENPHRIYVIPQAHESNFNHTDSFSHLPYQNQQNTTLLKSSYIFDNDDYDDAKNEPGRLIIDLDREKVDTHQDTEPIHGTMIESVPTKTIESISTRMLESIPTTMVMAPHNSAPHLQKIPTKRKRDRGPKSWEFLMRLLACQKTNPSIIRWEDESKGTFRLVQPQEIANIWSSRSNKKEDLSYNNFARALRYHYKSQLLIRISERQLVYGCGPTAMAFYHQVLKEKEDTSLGDYAG